METSPLEGRLARDKMAEAEVSVRLALFLLHADLLASDVEVAIDGAQVRTGPNLNFPLAAFLSAVGCMACDSGESWAGRYQVDGCAHGLRIHPTPGLGDVVARLTSGVTFRAECKKGPLGRSKSSVEYPLMREAIGQLMTVQKAEPSDIFAIAVPHSPKFCELASRWRAAPLITRVGIQVLTVARSGEVFGLDLT